LPNIILLFNQQDRRREWAGTRLNETIVQHVIHLPFNFIFQDRGISIGPHFIGAAPSIRGIEWSQGLGGGKSLGTSNNTANSSINAWTPSGIFMEQAVSATISTEQSCSKEPAGRSDIGCFAYLVLRLAPITEKLFYHRIPTTQGTMLLLMYFPVI